MGGLKGHVLLEKKNIFEMLIRGRWSWNKISVGFDFFGGKAEPYERGYGIHKGLLCISLYLFYLFTF